MKNPSVTPKWAQVLLAVALCTIAAAGGLLTMGLNFMFGMTRHWTVAVCFTLTDAAKLTLPLTMRRHGPSPFLICAFALCTVISVYAALSSWLTYYGQTLLDAGRTDEIRAAAERTLSAAETQLASITEAGSVATLEKLAATKKEAMDAEGRSGKNCKGDECKGRKWQEAQGEYTAALDRLSLAKRRDALEKQRDKAREELSAEQPRSLGAPDYLAAILGEDRRTIARADNIAIAALSIVAMEMLVSLMFYGAATAAPLLAARRPEAKPATAPPTPAPVDRQTAALLRLKILISNSPAGYVDLSRSELADRLSAPRSTIQDWISRWLAAGEICTEPGPNNRARLRLPPLDRKASA